MKKLDLYKDDFATEAVWNEIMDVLGEPHGADEVRLKVEVIHKQQTVIVPITEGDVSMFDGITVCDAPSFTWTFPDQYGKNVNIVFTKGEGDE